LTFQERTRDIARLRHWPGDMEADYNYTAGIAGDEFYQKLREEGKLLASPCATCGVAWLPPKIYCEKCLSHLTEFREIANEGTVSAFTVINVDIHEKKLSPPDVRALITFEGTRGGILHYLNVPPDAVKIGMKVKAVLKPKEQRTGTILDIAHFE